MHPGHKSKTYEECAFSTAAPQLWNQNILKMQKVLLHLKQNIKHFYSSNISIDYVCDFSSFSYHRKSVLEIEMIFIRTYIIIIIVKHYLCLNIRSQCIASVQV